MLTAAACSGENGTAPSVDPDTFLGEWVSRLDAILAESSQFEREILEDGEVTPAEHERAQLAYLDCIERGGVRVTEFETYDNGLVRSAAFSLENDNAELVLDRCETSFYKFVPEAFRIAANPNDSAEASAARVAQCLNDAGYDVPPSPADVGVLSQAVLDDPDGGLAFGECYEATKFGP